MTDWPSRLEVLAAARAEGVEPGADLAAIEAAARRRGYGLTLAAHEGEDVRGRPVVLHRATISRDGAPVAVAYLSESAQAAAFEALGRALVYERWRAAGRAGPTATPDGGEPAPPEDDSAP